MTDQEMGMTLQDIIAYIHALAEDGEGRHLVMVGGVIADPAPTTKPDMRPFEGLRASFHLIRLLRARVIVIDTVRVGLVVAVEVQ
jgi:methylmalonyl-CoA mutase cobalamin-binding subunit